MLKWVAVYFLGDCLTTALLFISCTLYYNYNFVLKLNRNIVTFFVVARLAEHTAANDDQEDFKEKLRDM